MASSLPSVEGGTKEEVDGEEDDVELKSDISSRVLSASLRSEFVIFVYLAPALLA
jgi:hypothetical protein